jgi:hypothetical protein
MLLPERIAQRLTLTLCGCYLWEGATDDKGYAIVWFDGRKQRLNRVLYKLRTGRYPSRRHEMLHACDTPRCSSPYHTRPGTRKTNAIERQTRGRTRGALTYKKAA